MRRNIPIVVVMVVFVVLRGGINVSCGSFCRSSKGSVVDNEHDAESLCLSSSIGGQNQVGDSISNGETTAVAGSYTKMKLFCLMLLAGIFTLGTGLIYNNVHSRFAKYDVEREAEEVSLALRSSSASTHEKLEDITKALCTRLSTSISDLPLDISTFAATTQRITTKMDTTEIDTTEGFTEVNTAAGETTNIITTEAMTTAVSSTTPVPETLCTDVAVEILLLIKAAIGNIKEGFIGFDLFDSTNKDNINTQLERINGKYCRDGFFKYGVINSHEGLSFKYDNDFVKFAVDANTCRKAVAAILPVLHEMGHDAETDCPRACRLKFDTDEMETELHRGLAIAYGTECGSGFFTYNENTKGIRYESSNSYIVEKWPDAICSKKCQKRADGVIALLTHFGHGNHLNFATKTVKNHLGKRDELLASWALGENCDCGSDGLRMETRDDRLIFRYQQRNPYAIKAWKRIPEIVACRELGKDIFEHISNFGWYTKEEYATFSIPDWNDYRVILMQKISAADGYNCKEGFFKYVEEDNDFILTYRKSNEYIQPQWDIIDRKRRCHMTGQSMVELFRFVHHSNKDRIEYYRFWYNSYLEQQMKAKMKIVEHDNCGVGFYRIFAFSNVPYCRVSFSQWNSFIRPYFKMRFPYLITY